MGLRVDGPGVQLAQVLHTRFRSGNYTLLGNAIGTLATLGVGVVRAYPVVVPSPVTLVRIGAEVTAIGDAGSAIRLGIYADDGQGFPGALVVDAGTIPGDVVAVSEIVIAQALAPNTYHFCGVVQNVTVTQPTVRSLNTPAVDSAAIVANTVAPVAGQGSVGRVMGGIAGALPAVWVDGGAGSALLRMHVKAA